MRDIGTVRDLIDVLDSDHFLPPEIVRLAAWVAEYYACGVGDAISAAMPPRAWIESERYAQITELGHARALIERGTRRELLHRLAAGKPMRVEAIAGDKRGAHAALLTLEGDGLIALTRPLGGSASAFRTVRVAFVTAQGLEVAQLEGDAANTIRLGARQREALARLSGAPEGLSTAQLADSGIGASSISRLAELGLVTIGRRRVERDPFAQSPAADQEVRAPLVLTSEQESALAQLLSLHGAHAFRTALLHGVTGSGKTEIYLRLAAAARQAGSGVLLLVPEIALTPAVARIFRAYFGDSVAIQHSGLSDGERYDQWHRIRRGAVDVVVGTRSAVFAPLARLGLVIVDEEHDGSYKQEEAPRYNGRDVAVMRARQAGALAVLGSATPSMESYQNALKDRYTLVTLKNRVLDRPLASVQIVDMRAEYAAAGPDVILSQPLCEALDARLAEREQAIVLLNRRGFASTVFCRQCAATLECPNCSVSLTVHKAAHRARCHYCNYSMTLPRACLNCAGPYLEQLGFGTERVEAEIQEKFPHARVARVDRDTIRKRGAIAALLLRFADGELDVLVGTQMIAKGHDFPRVTLVGVISADVGLGLADFRASERTFQLLTQVAGRAGRGEIRGQAVVQTLYPDHYSIRHACRQDYAGFFEEEIRFRRAMRYPPAVALVNVVIKGRTLEAAMKDAGGVVRALRRGGEPYRVLGPATAPLSRLKGEHRAQFFMKGTHRGAMRQALITALDARPDIRRRAIVDVDPMNVL
ncbi:MAG TPA: primosomal protein N' [Vicinamibacterales bacterium]|nr:primosomal protein N' [Vicinamibacterales bacterium]